MTSVFVYNSVLQYYSEARTVKFALMLHAASDSAPIGPAPHHVVGQSRAFQEPVRKKKNKTNPREL